jgi:hypothetical protein
MNDAIKAGVIASMMSEYTRILKELEKDIRNLDISHIDQDRLSTDPEYLRSIFNKFDPHACADTIAKAYLKAAIAMTMVQKKVNEVR